MTYRVLGTASEIEEYFRELETRKVECIAFDLEGEFNLHQYGEKLCLIQIFDGRNSLIIDPFAVEPEQIRRVMEDDSVQKVIYDSLGDQALVQKTLGFKISSIIDLRPAADLLEFERKDLGSVLDAVLGVRIEKKKKFQMYNWTVRPINPEAMEYALSDVRHLLELKERLLSLLDERGLMEEFRLRNLSVQNRDFSGDRIPRIFKSGEFLRLSRDRKTLFEKVHSLRDKHARELNFPPDLVLNKEQMFQLVSGRIAPEQVRSNRRVPYSARMRFVSELKRLL
ncbi:MAG TPA: ribonuclease D [Spirochaetia bacterium]|nr:ribonuclease D [Spirochaetia bacterium]